MSFSDITDSGRGQEQNTILRRAINDPNWTGIVPVSMLSYRCKFSKRNQNNNIHVSVFYLFIRDEVQLKIITQSSQESQLARDRPDQIVNFEIQKFWKKQQQQQCL